TFGGKVKLVWHDWGVLLEPAEPVKEGRRTRFLMLGPAQMTALHDHPGVERADITNLGTVHIGRENFLASRKSVRVSYDAGGRIPSGRIERTDPISSGESITVIDPSGKGTYHMVSNRGANVVLLRIDDLLVPPQTQN
ncbi:MAG: hypothetical protein KGH63_02855, partial [Candidatus Micrarchaeota archaeon]|nr:hypothetical protein [Candidatus Micrarchaeota archaeon]